MDETTAVSSEQDERVATDILRALRRILHSVTVHAKRLARETDLTLPQVAVLRELSAHTTAEATVAEIAKSIEVSSPTVTGIVDRLERSGLVTRVRGTSDRRKVFVSLTDAGRAKLHELPTQPQEKFVVGVMSLTPYERDIVAKSLVRILDLMETAEDFEPAPFLVAAEDLVDDAEEGSR